MSQNKKAAIEERLEATRSELYDVARTLDSDDWTQPIYVHDGEEWSASDILRHLTWAEGGMLRLMRNIRDGEGGVPDDFDLDRYNASGVRRLQHLTPAELMDLMAENRQEVLTFLSELDDEDFLKEGRHGSMRILTIEQILLTIALHEAGHLDDLRQAALDFGQ